jgi:hypothetical protein
MNRDIKSLEEKLKKSTGESDLPRKDITNTKKTKIFDASKFTKLASELKKIFTEDEQYPNTTIKSA